MAAQFDGGLFFAAADAFHRQKDAARLFGVVYGLFCRKLWRKLAAERPPVYGRILSLGHRGGNAARQAEMGAVLNRSAGCGGLHRAVRASMERVVTGNMKNAPARRGFFMKLSGDTLLVLAAEMLFLWLGQGISVSFLESDRFRRRDGRGSGRCSDICSPETG